MQTEQGPNFSRLIAAKGSFATPNGGGVLGAEMLLSELGIYAELFKQN